MMRQVTVLGVIFVLLGALRPGLAAEPLHLDGKATGLVAQRSSSLDLEDAVTVEAWVKPEELEPVGARIVDKGAPGTNDGFLLDTHPGNSLRMIVAQGAISYRANLPTDRWSHVAGVFSSSEGIYKLYLNGREVASQGRAGMKKMIVTPFPLRVGADTGGGSRFRGQIARVTVYNRPLTSPEIAALAADESYRPHDLPGRVADWSFADPDAGEYLSTAPGQLKLRLNHWLDRAKLTGQSPPPDDPTTTLWYRQPAKAWTEAMPIGNGRQAAMVFGGVGHERIQLNEDTIWSGSPHDYDHPDAFSHLAEIRKLIDEREFAEALKLGDRTMLGQPAGQASYQPLGDLLLDFAGHETAQDYRRELDLEKSLVRVSYRMGDAHYQREVFASWPDHVLVMRLTCGQPKRLSFGLRVDSPHPHTVAASPKGTLVLDGQVQIGHFDGERQGVQFQTQVQVRAEGGKLTAAEEALTIEGADTVTLVWTSASSYKNYQDISGDPADTCEKVLRAARQKSYEQLRDAHMADCLALFNRCRLDLDGQEAGGRPTDERVAAVQGGATDSLLVSQSFQFGRYLLIAGSRPGSQPLNLQGKWNESVSPPWGSKWTLNCNAEINYWPVETCNLGELHEPLLRMVEELREPGRRTAKVNYNCRGWMIHHNADIWRGTAVVDGFSWGIFPVGGAWLCQHLWEHYDFSRDKEYLARVYPTMKESAEFFVDFLIPDRHGNLVTSPSISFEQGFRTPDGKTGRLCAGPTLDRVILRDLLTHCIQASEILGRDEAFRAKLIEVRSRLAPVQISPRTGQIQEWAEDWDPDSVGTGQLAPLWALYPGDQITPWGTPDLAVAAKATLLGRRMVFGSWCSAMRVNYAARLSDGELFAEMLQNHMQKHVMPSLLSNFSRDLFQIDGNQGVTAGIAEALLQSHAGVIHLLPALPKTWQTGSLKGLRARGGFEVDIAWKDGRVVTATIRSTGGKNPEIHYGQKSVKLPLDSGQAVSLGSELSVR